MPIVVRAVSSSEDVRAVVGLTGASFPAECGQVGRKGGAGELPSAFLRLTETWGRVCGPREPSNPAPARWCRPGLAAVERAGDRGPAQSALALATNRCGGWRAGAGPHVTKTRFAGSGGPILGAIQRFKEPWPGRARRPAPEGRANSRVAPRARPAPAAPPSRRRPSSRADSRGRQGARRSGALLREPAVRRALVCRHLQGVTRRAASGRRWASGSSAAGTAAGAS